MLTWLNKAQARAVSSSIFMGMVLGARCCVRLCKLESIGIDSLKLFASNVPALYIADSKDTEQGRALRTAKRQMWPHMLHV